MTAEPTLYAVVGATGTGKSEFALDLVETLRTRGRDAEIIGADAMQLYRGMDIGTAKLPVAERRGIPHHLIDVLDPVQDAAVAWYQEEARVAASEIFSRGKDAVLVGGSGLYVSSVLFDFRFPPRDERLRARLEAELERDGVDALFARLRALDPATAAKIDARNARRVVRALEVVELGETTHGAALPEAPEHWHPHRIFALDVDRGELVRRLDGRVHDMWRSGLLAEVEHLREHGIEDGPTASRAIGYAQALDQLRGVLSESEAIEQTQALTRRYARRQVSWFRRYADAVWLDPRELRPGQVLPSGRPAANDTADERI